MSFLFLLLLTATELSNSLIEVPPSRWKAVRLTVDANDTIVLGHFRVVSGSTVQLIIADRLQAERFHRGRSFSPIYTSGFEKEAKFRTMIHGAGEYVLLLDNRVDARGPAVVEVAVQQLPVQTRSATELPPERRRAVVAASLLFFGAILVFSAWQFLAHGPGG